MSEDRFPICGQCGHYQHWHKYPIGTGRRCGCPAFQPLISVEPDNA